MWFNSTYSKLLTALEPTEYENAFSSQLILISMALSCWVMSRVEKKGRKFKTQIPLNSRGMQNEQEQKQTNTGEPIPRANLNGIVSRCAWRDVACDAWCAVVFHHHHFHSRCSHFLRHFRCFRLNTTIQWAYTMPPENSVSKAFNEISLMHKARWKCAV